MYILQSAFTFLHFHILMYLKMFQDITGEFYLQWMDRHGSYHNVTSLGENNCNRNWPKLLRDHP